MAVSMEMRGASPPEGGTENRKEKAYLKRAGYTAWWRLLQREKAMPNISTNFLFLEGFYTDNNPF
jgi:hypothetical protein